MAVHLGLIWQRQYQYQYQYQNTISSSHLIIIMKNLMIVASFCVLQWSRQVQVHSFCSHSSIPRSGHANFKKSSEWGPFIRHRHQIIKSSQSSRHPSFLVAMSGGGSSSSSVNINNDITACCLDVHGISGTPIGCDAYPSEEMRR